MNLIEKVENLENRIKIIENELGNNTSGFKYSKKNKRISEIQKLKDFIGLE